VNTAKEHARNQSRLRKDTRQKYQSLGILTDELLVDALRKDAEIIVLKETVRVLLNFIQRVRVVPTIVCEDEKNLICLLYDSGWPVALISKMLTRNPRSIHRYVKEAKDNEAGNFAT
jgi:hypothetical protein